MDDPRNPTDMTDEECIAAVRECAKLGLYADDVTAWCVYVTRMKALLEEITGQPVDHGGDMFAFKEARRRLP